MHPNVRSRPSNERTVCRTGTRGLPLRWLGAGCVVASLACSAPTPAQGSSAQPRSALPRDVKCAGPTCSTADEVASTNFETQPTSPECPASQPSVFDSELSGLIRRIAIGPNDVYWYGGDAIYRRPKAGGKSQKLTDVESSGGGLFADGSNLYWSRYPSLFSIATDDSNGPVQLVQDATEVSSWTANGSNVYYLTRPTDPQSRFPYELRAAPSNGGPGTTLAPVQAEALELAADASGVYWYSVEYDGDFAVRSMEIQKYSFATSVVSRLAPVQERSEFLQIAADRVLWFDTNQIWSGASDGSERFALGSAPLLRALTSNQTSVFWATSAPGDEYSDIVAVPRGGGPAHLLACHVSSIDAFVADDSALYYHTWLGDIIGKIDLRQP
jgi:hypothetical protein